MRTSKFYAMSSRVSNATGPALWRLIFLPQFSSDVLSPQCCFGCTIQASTLQENFLCSTMKIFINALTIVALSGHTMADESLLQTTNPLNLNTAEAFEDVTTMEQRMAMNVPDHPDHIPPNYDPLEDAVCFNNMTYSPSTPDAMELYSDFSKIFHHGLAVSEHTCALTTCDA